MTKYTYELSSTHNNYPNIIVYERYRDGETAGWKVESDWGYQMYNSNTEENAQIYYTTCIFLNPYYDWDSFDWVAVLVESK